MVRGRVMTDDTVDLVAGTANQRDALVQVAGHAVENTGLSIGRSPVRLFDQESDRVGLIDQPQPAIAVALPCIARVEVDAAAPQDAEYFCDQRSDPAHIEILAARAVRAGETILDIGPYR